MNDCEVWSVVVSGGDVYYAGRDASLPTLWKNGALLYTLETTGGTNLSRRMGLCIFNGDIYVVGEKYPNPLCGALLWKNGGTANGGQTIVYGSNLCKAFSVFVSKNGDIYMAGQAPNCGNYDAAMWKNGKGSLLSGGGGSAYCVVVTDSINNGNNWGNDVGIAETIQGAGLTVYPNPTNNQLTIDNGELTIVNYSIYSVVGQVVMQGKAPLSPPEGGKQLPSFGGAGGGLIIDVSHLASGMYFLKIDGKTVRFVKE